MVSTDDLPSDVEWLDGSRRTYRGYSGEIDGNVLLLTDINRRTKVIPLANVRELTINEVTVAIR